MFHRAAVKKGSSANRTTVSNAPEKLSKTTCAEYHYVSSLFKLEKYPEVYLLVFDLISRKAVRPIGDSALRASAARLMCAARSNRRRLGLALPHSVSFSRLRQAHRSLSRTYQIH